MLIEANKRFLSFILRLDWLLCLQVGDTSVRLASRVLTAIKSFTEVYGRSHIFAAFASCYPSVSHNGVQCLAGLEILTAGAE